MRRLIGLSLSLALALTALATVPVAANSDKGTDVGQDVMACSGNIDGINFYTTDTLNRWQGTEYDLLCTFKGLDVSGYTGADPLKGMTVVYEGPCSITANPDPPYQPDIVGPGVFAVNQQGNGWARCTASSAS